MKQKIVIVGLGLIGGSLAKAFRRYTDCTVLGMDRDGNVLKAATEAEAIHRTAGTDDLRSADVVFLCLYPEACVRFAEEHRADFRPGGLVTDTCGIKSWLCPRMKQLADENDFFFVGSHPMAGKEKNGFAHSDAALFLGASYILVPYGAPESETEKLKMLVSKLGFSRTVETTPEEHDHIIAFTSQLPHVLACAYVMSPQCPKHKGFSAGSYRDVSRVANINEAMWTELFLENREALTEELDTLTGHIAEIRNAVNSGDAETLRGLLRRGRLVKEGLDE